jgi:hypothetical protein
VKKTKDEHSLLLLLKEKAKSIEETEPVEEKTVTNVEAAIHVLQKKGCIKMSNITGQPRQVFSRPRRRV